MRYVWLEHSIKGKVLETSQISQEDHIICEMEESGYCIDLLKAINNAHDEKARIRISNLIMSSLHTVSYSDAAFYINTDL